MLVLTKGEKRITLFAGGDEVVLEYFEPRTAQKKPIRFSEKYKHEQVREITERIDFYTRAYGMRMTPEQYRSYSREWREHMDMWQSRGFNITRENGMTVVWSEEVEICFSWIVNGWLVIVKRPCLCARTETDEGTIGLINYWIDKVVEKGEIAA